MARVARLAALLVVLLAPTALADGVERSLPPLTPYVRLHLEVPVIRVFPPSIGVGDSHGSGFVAEGGIVVTAAHCVDDASAITVEFSDGSMIEAVSWRHDEGRDVGVVILREVPARLMTLRLAKTKAKGLIRVRTTAFWGRSFRSGRAVEVYGDAWPSIHDETEYATTCPFMPGMSGGVVCSVYGVAVGVVSSKTTDVNMLPENYIAIVTYDVIEALLSR